MDEPTNNLDVDAERVVLKTLSDFCTQCHAACLFVTHDLGLAGRYATHVGLVAEGGVLAGVREDVLTRANLERLYGSVPRGSQAAAPEAPNRPLETQECA